MSIISQGSSLVKLFDGFSFTEGPAADKEGAVYFTDQPNDRIVKWSPGEGFFDGSIEDWMRPCQRCNGMRFDCEGNIIACADLHNQLWKISLDKSVTILVKDFEGHLLNGPNDNWPHPNGQIYITDPLYPRDYWSRDPKSQLDGEHVYCLSSDYKSLTVAARDLVKPNGIIGTPDGKTLYVADIGDNKTYRYTIAPDGSLVDRHLFCSLGSDGMTLDEKGNVYLTGHGVTVFDPAGLRIEHIDVPEKWVGNICFAGRDHKLLFMCASKGIYGIAMSVRGAFPTRD